MESCKSRLVLGACGLAFGYGKEQGFALLVSLRVRLYGGVRTPTLVCLWVESAPA